MKPKMVKMKAGNIKIPVVMTTEKGRIFFQFPFNRKLMAEIKAMRGSKWHGYDEVNPRKIWSVKDCARNRFQINYLCGKNPYEKYDSDLLIVKPNRIDIVYEHQIEMIRHGITRRQCILACEMRTGKTLAAIEIMELSKLFHWLWVGPKSSLPEVELQFETWEAGVIPRFMTYDRFRISIKDGTFLELVGRMPDGIVFDELTKLKNATTQRSQAAQIIVEEMRAQNPDCFIIGMSGAPAPKSPVDWWHQCEITCPGFLREGDQNKFKRRLALIVEKQSMTGAAYPELVTWFDNEEKCKICGKFSSEHVGETGLSLDHPFEFSVNEVKHLYKRMQGLVLVKFRKDCMDLPETQFRTIRIEPDESTKRAASVILNAAPRAVTALMLLRELSDGFQYKEVTDGTEKCSICSGTGSSMEPYDPDNPEDPISDEALQSGRIEYKEDNCYTCNGKGEVPKVIRTAKRIPCPKEQVLIDLLDEHEPIGRFVVYAGFQDSVDRCVEIALRYQWDVIRVDGRGWAYFSVIENDLTLTEKEMLARFKNNDIDKIVFIGQAGAAGMGLTLTASPSILFYSNSFNGEDRIQAMERIQGPGMDLNRGATVIDIIHLDVDEYILDNLAKKIKLLDLSMGRLREAVLEKTNE